MSTDCKIFNNFKFNYNVVIFYQQLRLLIVNRPFQNAKRKYLQYQFLNFYYNNLTILRVN